MLKETRSWDDETLCREFRITAEAVKDIEHIRKPPSEEALGLKMLYEIFPLMAACVLCLCGRIWWKRVEGKKKTSS